MTKISGGIMYDTGSIGSPLMLFMYMDLSRSESHLADDSILFNTKNTIHEALQKISNWLKEDFH